jgi:serine/threonine protein kinase
MAPSRSIVSADHLMAGMSPLLQSDKGIPQEGAKEVAIELSNSLQFCCGDESTPALGLEATTSSDPQQSGTNGAQAPWEPMPKQIANRYDVVSVLGIGGQAAVFLADDPRLRRKVAIKIPKTIRPLQLVDKERFEREAQAIAALNHPGIVTVHDFELQDDGRCYIVLEYLPGQSLKECLKSPASRSQFTVQRTVEFMSQVADALHYAHQRGIYHRDLKPGNILLDEHEVPHITDFGLAITRETQVDLRGQVAGTIPYMAPEQVRGEAHWINGQTDIWALGVILYQMLAQRRPFQGATNEEIYDEILHRTPTSLRELNPQVSKTLDEIVLKCLEKDPSRRFGTAADLRQALATCLLPVEVAGHTNNLRIKQVLWGAATLAILSVILLLAREIVTPAAMIVSPDEQVGAGPRAEPRPGEWQFLLDRPPDQILWPFPAEPSSDWSFLPEKRKVTVLTDKRHLLRLGSTDRNDYDLSITLKQAPWLGGRMGLFLGCHESPGSMPRTTQYETVTVEWNGPQSDKPLSVNHSLHLESSEGSPILRHVPYILDATAIPIPGFKSLTLNISVRKQRVQQITVLGDDAKALPLMEFQPTQQPSLPTVQGFRAIPLAVGNFGLFVDESSDGVSGEYSSFGFRLLNKE